MFKVRDELISIFHGVLCFEDKSLELGRSHAQKVLQYDKNCLRNSSESVQTKSIDYSQIRQIHK